MNIFRSYLEYYGVVKCSIPSDSPDTNLCKQQNSISYVTVIETFLKMVIVCITLVVAIIPEALPLAFGVTVNTYSKQAIMSTDDINKKI